MQIRKGKPYTPVHDEGDELFPVGYVCGNCEAGFRETMYSLRFGHLSVVK